MAKDSRNKTIAVQQVQTKKRQKKLAKKEAKMMLVIEQVKDSLEKAQDKLARAQARVEARKAHLRNLEQKLAAQRASSQSGQAEAPESGFDHQGGPSDTQQVATDQGKVSASSTGSDNHASSLQDTAEAPAQTTATSDQQSDEALPAAIAQRPTTRTPRARITRGASTTSAKPATSSTPARRVTTRKRTNTNNKTSEASNDNKSE